MRLAFQADLFRAAADPTRRGHLPRRRRRQIQWSSHLPRMLGLSRWLW